MFADCRGPRGGRVRADVSCLTCVAYLAPCRPAECSVPLGCESWVNVDGCRVIMPTISDLDAVELDAEPVLAPYEDPPAPFQPEPLDGPQGCLPMPDAGPLFK